uniref:Uncharacterized protein n=1 Tax=Peronospora matthiolae TaxID=2874970 RepID=A0AAV1VJ65_9STRA
MQEMASKRLQLQRAADEAAQAAVTPAAVGTAPLRPPPTVEPQRTGRLWPSRKPPVSTESPSSGEFYVLQDSSSELEKNGAVTAQAPSTDGVTDDSPITSESDPNMAPDVARARPRLSSEDRVRQKDSKQRGTAFEISGPTLLAKQRLERKICKRLVKQQQKGQCTSIPMDPRPEIGPFHLNDL